MQEKENASKEKLDLLNRIFELIPIEEINEVLNDSIKAYAMISETGIKAIYARPKWSEKDKDHTCYYYGGQYIDGQKLINLIEKYFPNVKEKFTISPPDSFRSYEVLTCSADISVEELQEVEKNIRYAQFPSLLTLAARENEKLVIKNPEEYRKNIEGKSLTDQMKKDISDKLPKGEEFTFIKAFRSAEKPIESIIICLSKEYVLDKEKNKEKIFSDSTLESLKKLRDAGIYIQFEMGYIGDETRQEINALKIEGKEKNIKLNPFVKGVGIFSEKNNILLITDFSGEQTPGIKKGPFEGPIAPLSIIQITEENILEKALNDVLTKITSEEEKVENGGDPEDTRITRATVEDVINATQKESDFLDEDGQEEEEKGKGKGKGEEVDSRPLPKQLRDLVMAGDIEGLRKFIKKHPKNDELYNFLWGRDKDEDIEEGEENEGLLDGVEKNVTDQRIKGILFAGIVLPHFQNESGEIEYIKIKKVNGRDTNMVDFAKALNQVAFFTSAVQEGKINDETLCKLLEFAVQAENIKLFEALLNSKPKQEIIDVTLLTDVLRKTLNNVTGTEAHVMSTDKWKYGAEYVSLLVDKGALVDNEMTTATKTFRRLVLFEYQDKQTEKNNIYLKMEKILRKAQHQQKLEAAKKKKRHIPATGEEKEGQFIEFRSNLYKKNGEKKSSQEQAQEIWDDVIAPHYTPGKKMSFIYSSNQIQARELKDYYTSKKRKKIESILTGKGQAPLFAALGKIIEENNAEADIEILPFSTLREPIESRDLYKEKLLGLRKEKIEGGNVIRKEEIDDNIQEIENRLSEGRMVFALKHGDKEKGRFSIGGGVAFWWSDKEYKNIQDGNRSMTSGAYVEEKLNALAEQYPVRLYTVPTRKGKEKVGEENEDEKTQQQPQSPAGKNAKNRKEGKETDIRGKLGYRKEIYVLDNVPKIEEGASSFLQGYAKKFKSEHGEFPYFVDVGDSHDAKVTPSQWRARGVSKELNMVTISTSYFSNLKKKIKRAFSSKAKSVPTPQEEIIKSIIALGFLHGRGKPLVFLKQEEMYVYGIGTVASLIDAINRYSDPKQIENLKEELNDIGKNKANGFRIGDEYEKAFRLGQAYNNLEKEYKEKSKNEKIGERKKIYDEWKERLENVEIYPQALQDDLISFFKNRKKIAVNDNESPRSLFNGLPNPKFTFSQILAFNDAELEGYHSWVQTVFPTLRESNAYGKAPLLTPQAQAYLWANPHIQDLAFKRVLQFFGLKLLEDENGLFVVGKAENFDKRAEEWLQFDNHNYKRISRILESLCLCGQSDKALALYTFLAELQQDTKYTSQMMTWQKNRQTSSMKKVNVLPIWRGKIEHYFSKKELEENIRAVIKRKVGKEDEDERQEGKEESKDDVGSASTSGENRPSFDKTMKEFHAVGTIKEKKEIFNTYLKYSERETNRLIKQPGIDESEKMRLELMRIALVMKMNAEEYLAERKERIDKASAAINQAGDTISFAKSRVFSFFGVKTSKHMTRINAGLATEMSKDAEQLWKTLNSGDFDAKTIGEKYKEFDTLLKKLQDHHQRSLGNKLGVTVSSFENKILDRGETLLSEFCNRHSTALRENMSKKSGKSS